MPPYNLEAEQGVLGSILLDNDTLSEVLLILKPEDFYRDTHQLVYKAILAMHATSRPVDVITLENELKKRGDLANEDGGELGFILSLINSVPHAANAKYYAQIIVQNAVKREAIHTANQVLADGYSDQFTAEELLDKAETNIFGIRKRRESTEVQTIEGLLPGAMSEIRSILAGEFLGVGSGLEELDRLVGGFRAGQLVVIGARPSMGKSALMLNMAEAIAGFERKPVYIASLEMGSAELAMRWLTSMARVDYTAVREGRLVDSDFEAMNNAIIRSKELSVLIDASPSRTAAQIAATARIHAAKVGLAAIMVDYIQLVSGIGDRRNASRTEEVGMITRRLKESARELGVPVFALSQLNRAVETRAKDDRRPMMADLRESGNIEQDADVVLMIHRPEYYDANDSPGQAEIIVAKNRNGPTGIARVAFVKKYTRFESLSLRNL